MKWHLIFSALDFPIPNIIGTESQPDNACKSTREETIDLLASADLLIDISLLFSTKESIYKLTDCQLCLSKFEQSNTKTSVSFEITLTDFLIPSITTDCTCC